MNNFIRIALVGIGATFTVDLSTFIIGLFTYKSHGILYIGRWVAYVFKGTFFYNNIIDTPSVANELFIGWVTHYTIGILFAFTLIAVFGKKWLANPNFLAPMVIGSVTLFLPICILQPAMGFGIAFSKLPNMWFLLFKIILIHIVYGSGLYLAAIILKKIKANYTKFNNQIR